MVSVLTGNLLTKSESRLTVSGITGKVSRRTFKVGPHKQPPTFSIEQINPVGI
jgi:hypothetical protein